MRTLILTRGAPGAGKSTWIKNHNLQNYTIEPDQLRLLMSSPELKPNGTIGISQSKDPKVWKLVIDLLEERMKDGALTVIDATHSRTQLINRYRKLAKLYRYRVFVIDFSLVPLKTCLENNAKRPPLKFVPEDRIADIHARFAVDTPASWVTTIQYNDKEAIQKILTLSPIDCNSYKAINIIGDIHSSFTALSNIVPIIKEDELYIFLGDYLDRGAEPVETFQFISSIASLPNVILLEGNHETHWRRLRIDPERRLPAQTKKTIEELSKANIDPSSLFKLYDKLAQCSYFSYNNKTYFCSHAGIPTLPSPFIATKQLVDGVGSYSDSTEVDQKANELDIISIHGHRNIVEEPLQNNLNTFNLNGKPEFGKELRAIRITPEGIKNISEIQPKDKSFSEPPKKVVKFTGNSLLSDYTNNPLVNVKQLNNGLYSINFTKKAFRSRQWSEMTIKARGLFLDKDSNVVMRSYQKFFHYKEQPETSSEAIKKLSYPLKVWQKENGFLGLLSFYQDDWLICSKTTNEGPYKEMFKELVTPYLSDWLKQELIDKNLTLVFEVNHLNDPHLVKYNSSHLVLLDGVYNTTEFSKLSDSQRLYLARKLNIKTKQLTTTLTSYEEWRAFRESQQQKSIYISDVEGWVIEDSKGFQFKLKSEFYSFWKRMRSIKDSYYKRYDSPAEVVANLHREPEYKFFSYLKTLDREDLLKPIIDLREDYLRKEH